MPTHSHLVEVAKRLKRRLKGEAFLTIPRVEVTQLLREVSGEDATRIKASMGGELERVLLEQGIRCFPGFMQTTTGDTVRLFHAGTVLGQLVDLLAYPAPSADNELGQVLLKVKGMWNWPRPPAGLPDEGRPLVQPVMGAPDQSAPLVEQPAAGRQAT